MKNKVDLKLPKIIQLPSGSYQTKIMLDGVRYNITKDTMEECAAEAAALKYKAKEAKKAEDEARIKKEQAQRDIEVEKNRVQKEIRTEIVDVALEVAKKKKCFERVFECSIEDSVYEELSKYINE